MGSKTPVSSTSPLAAAVGEAIDRIAPLWPLDRFVAVNPFLGFMHRPFSEACAALAQVTGRAPLPTPAEFTAWYDAGEITDADLAATGGAESPDRLHDALARTTADQPGVSTLAEFADRREGRSHWAPFIADEIGRWCGTYFDQNQTTWRSPWAGHGLYHGWREAALHDRNPEAFGVRRFRASVATLPTEPLATAIEVLTALQVTPELATAVIHRTLLSVAGWAGYLRYLAHQRRLEGETQDQTVELLGIRLAFEFALVRSGRLPAGTLEAWRDSLAAVPAPDVRITWQRAYERHLRVALSDRLIAQEPAELPSRPAIQAVFCIDVRSEPLRRHLESVYPGIETLGFAGFFGFPVAQPGPDGHTEPRCPVLIPPQLQTIPPPASATARSRAERTVKAIQNSAASTFSAVEMLGLALTPALFRTAVPPSRPTCTRTERARALLPVDAERLADFAAGALRGMSLGERIAPLVLLCGHGSRSANNPHAASLQCGACGGYAGDANARIAAEILNRADVRARLAARGVHVPADTWFIAGLHDTITDEVAVFDTDSAPAMHAGNVAALVAALNAAAENARHERAPGSRNADPAGLRNALERRAEDPAQVRPEWALANNSAIIVAPRARTRGLNLGGRAFLHDYEHARDHDGGILRLILSAPVVVASWINLQYYASRVDPARYGAGSKLLHNVVGGLGVVEGNGGDLRVGLPWQSVHDGTSFRHEPRRLTVYVEAPRAKLDEALAALPDVRSLFAHEWLELVAIEDTTCWHLDRGRWRVEGAAVPAPYDRRASTSRAVGAAR